MSFLTKSPSSPALIAVTVASLVALAACSAAGEVETAPPQASAPAVEPGPSTAPPEADDDAAPGDAASDTCFVGSWMLEIDSWDAGIVSVVASELSDPAVDTTGSLSLTLGADQAYRVSGSALRTVTTGSGNGGDLKWVLGFDGDESGTWYTVSDILILDPGESGPLSAQNEVEIDGVPLEGVLGDPSSTPWSDDLDVACDATTLTLTPLNDPAAIPVVFRL